MPVSPFTGGYKMQERGTAMLPRLKSEVVGKTFIQDYGNSSHATA